MAGLAKGWDEEKVKEIFEKYGEIVNTDLHQSSKPKHKDFGFAVKVNPPRVLLMSTDAGHVRAYMNNGCGLMGMAANGYDETGCALSAGGC
ncbi:nucleotide-binding alpha-beta plait domain-containing protein [Tanacetum coccineum]